MSERNLYIPPTHAFIGMGGRTGRIEYSYIPQLLFTGIQIADPSMGYGCRTPTINSRVLTSHAFKLFFLDVLTDFHNLELNKSKNNIFGPS